MNKKKAPQRDKRAVERDNWRTLHDMVSKENKRKGLVLYATNQLVGLIEDYNKLLSDELNELVGLAAVHGWKSSRFQLGETARKNIEAMKSKIKSIE